MKDRNLFEPYYQLKSSRNYLRLTRKGKALAISMGLTPVSPPYLSQVEHDELIADFLLSNESLFEKFWTEGHLKKFPATIKGFISPRQMKYPDLLVVGKNSNRKIAVEYERSRKSSFTYQRILLSYSLLPDIASVLFIVETEAIKQAIKDMALKARYPSELKPLLFAMSKDVKTNATLFPIEVGKEQMNFQWLLRPYEAAT